MAVVERIHDNIVLMIGVLNIRGKAILGRKRLFINTAT